MTCAECGGPIHENELCRDVVDEYRGSPIVLPAHLDCRLALAREWRACVQSLLVALMQRRVVAGKARAA